VAVAVWVARGVAVEVGVIKGTVVAVLDRSVPSILVAGTDVIVSGGVGDASGGAVVEVAAGWTTIKGPPPGNRLVRLSGSAASASSSSAAAFMMPPDMRAKRRASFWSSP